MVEPVFISGRTNHAHLLLLIYLYSLIQKFDKKINVRIFEDLGMMDNPIWKVKFENITVILPFITESDTTSLCETLLYLNKAQINTHPFERQYFIDPVDIRFRYRWLATAAACRGSITTTTG